MRSSADRVRATQLGACVGLLLLGSGLGGSAFAATGGATEAYPPFGLLETSGMAVSGLHDGVVWVVEDSGEPPDDLPVVRAFDPSGAEVGSVTLAGWNNRDTEALSMGPGPTLWVGDIGDNLAVRGSVVVHTFEEPAELGATTLEPVSYRLRYPDGPRDAESLMIDPVDGRLYVVTKSGVGGGSLYAAPAGLEPDATHDLTLVGRVRSFVTDGSFTPDGRQVLLRAVSGLSKAQTVAVVLDVVRGEDGSVTRLVETGQVALPDQEQGESLTVTTDGQTILVGSEGTDEPVWAVPLVAAAQPSATPSGSSGPVTATAAGPSRSDQAVPDLDACRLADPTSCLDEPTWWLAALGVGLAAMLVAALAVLRRSASTR